MDDKLTAEDKEYIDKWLPKKLEGDFYYDNPGAAIEDVEWLIEIIKRLVETE